MEELRQCSICSKYFPNNTDYFYKNKTGKDGLSPYCKECEKKKSRKWTIENMTKEELIEISRIQNLKPYRKIQRRELAVEQRLGGYQKEYYYENKDKYKGYQKTAKIKRHKISKQEWMDCKKYFKDCCAYCGMSINVQKSLFNQDFHKEHVDDGGANDLSNCVPACKNCNSHKWKFGLDEWYNVENPIFYIERYNRIILWINKEYKNYLDNGI